MLMRHLANLCLPVAGGVLALGWATSRLVGFPAWPYAPLWFAGALLVYTANRLHPDPADRINCPARLDSEPRLRRGRIAILIASGCAVVVWPIGIGDGVLLAGALGAAAVGLAYVMRLPGLCRLKDLPVAKTFLPAIVVSAVILCPAVGRGSGPRDIGVGTAWLLCLTLFSASLCDHLDRAGDVATGVRTIPALLGASATRGLLWILAVAAVGCALWAAVMNRGQASAAAWLWTAGLLAPYLALLITRVERMASPHARDWFVEGMLYLPAAACLFSGA